MDTKQFLDDFQKITVDMYSTAKKKNSDYASGIANSDPLANFTMVEKFSICPPEVGFLTRMCDKFSRVISFVNNKELLVKDESVEDTLLDLANYSILMILYIRSKKLRSSIPLQSHVAPPPPVTKERKL